MIGDSKSGTLWEHTVYIYESVAHISPTMHWSDESVLLCSLAVMSMELFLQTQVFVGSGGHGCLVVVSIFSYSQRHQQRVYLKA